MRTELTGAMVTLTATLLGCAGRQAPVPLIGAEREVAALVGEWVGEYSSAETGRSGSISFTLAARGDTAYGDVVMIPTGWGRPLTPSRRETEIPEAHSLPEVLTIRFVRVQGAEVSGALAPYRDPACGCELYTTFVGRLTGDVIEGTYRSRHERSSVEPMGWWRVMRKPAAGP